MPANHPLHKTVRGQPVNAHSLNVSGRVEEGQAGRVSGSGMVVGEGAAQRLGHAGTSETGDGKCGAIGDCGDCFCGGQDSRR